MALTNRETQYIHRRTKKGTISNKLQSSKKNAKAKSLTFDLTNDFLSLLWEEQDGKCALSGATLGYIGTGWNAASIDRIDSTKGYVMGNVQWVCWRVNDAKANMQNEDFINFCAAVVLKNFSK